MFSTRLAIDLERAVLDADENLVPLVEGVVWRFGGIPAGEVPLKIGEDQTVGISGNGPAAGTPDEFAAGGWRGGSAGFPFDMIDALDG